MVASEPDAYLAAHARDALATDARVAELGLDVTVAGDLVVVTGTVSTPERRAAVAEVLAEVAPGHEVRNDTIVAGFAEPDVPETLT